jgi:hypothetical protein
MLDDRQLENLIRMAAEVEAIDALSSSPASLRLTGGSPTRESRRWSIGRTAALALTGITAAAASLVLLMAPGGLLAPATPAGNGTKAAPAPYAKGGGPKAMPEEIAAAIDNPTLWSGTGAAWPPALPWPFNGELASGDSMGEVVPASYESTGEIRGALLAIIEDEGGGIECVKWVEHDWGRGRTPSDVKASELVALSLMMTCDRTPGRMTVVGLKGPAAELPLDDAQAQEFATCILRAPARCSAQTCCNPGAASECIPEDVTARFERVSFR